MCKNSLTSTRPLTTLAPMKHPRYMLLAGLLCFAFWWIVAWSCTGAPGGAPLPQEAATGQTEFCGPRASTFCKPFLSALCLIQDPVGDKLYPQTCAFSVQHAWFGNADRSSLRGNYSPVIRSSTRTVVRCDAAKYNLVGVLPHTNAHNRLLNTNWLVVLRRITELTFT